MQRPFDPELLYVECTHCGQPLLWQAGETTRLLDLAGVDPSTLDEHCMLASDGCPSCQPEKTHFSTRVVRLAKIAESDSAEDLGAG